MYQTQAVIQHTLGKKNPGLAECRWPEDGLHYIPDWVYTSQAVHDLELQKIFRGRSWNYVALEAEIPNAGDFKRSYGGATPVV
ncbi:MAG: biphenyl 2,3-dioxygenase, partial [Cupriavidus sp.]|nr:biphenyl 2,3-dioxygenase [Cupriavidus sp.]